MSEERAAEAALAQGAERGGPLAGVRVLDLTRALAGPFCSMMFGDMGADVVKIERPGEGDETRAWGPPFVGSESTYYLSANRNKRSLALDLRQPRGRELLLRLAERADVLLENFRPGVMARLGLDYDTVADRNPAIIYCSISAFGQDGPLGHLPGYDLTLQGIGGVMSVTGEPGGRPLKVGVAETDIIGAMAAAFSIMNALYARDAGPRRREPSGQDVLDRLANEGQARKPGRRTGRWLDISLLDGQVALMGYHLSGYLASGNVPRPIGNSLPYIVPYQAFQTATQEILVAVNNERMWQDFCAALERPDLAGDSRFASNPLRVQHRDTLVPLLEEVLLTQSAATWLARLQERGIPCGPINSMQEVAAEPQLQHRNMIRSVQHPLGEVRLPGVAWKAAPPDAEPPIAPPPMLGQHTADVLADWLNLSDEEVRDLRKAGVV